jgi:hypothetical protein
VLLREGNDLGPGHVGDFQNQLFSAVFDLGPVGFDLALQGGELRIWNFI